MHDLCKLALEGNFEGARRIHNQLLELMGLIFAEGSPAGIKAALNGAGICGESVRLPLVPVSAALKEKIVASLKKL
jgi:4-hydroxy-tetrahydrodipicolinate synthase